MKIVQIITVGISNLNKHVLHIDRNTDGTEDWAVSSTDNLIQVLYHLIKWKPVPTKYFTEILRHYHCGSPTLMHRVRLELGLLISETGTIYIRHRSSTRNDLWTVESVEELLNKIEKIADRCALDNAFMKPSEYKWQFRIINWFNNYFNRLSKHIKYNIKTTSRH